ncbi:hypothetical protein G9A89_006317 [Geosiphon pyriformis]|nr:hypothetical protein G9A89_006317 [Geosiphon pyriformis]
MKRLVELNVIPPLKEIVPYKGKQFLKKYAWYANLAYSLEDKVLASSVIGGPNELVIYFRGSLLLPTEWMTAFSGKMVDYPLYENAKVNKKFWHQFKKADFRFSDILDKMIENPETAVSEITFVGHGMGAAVYATFAALDFYLLKSRQDISLQLFTYGQPRIGNRQFARALNTAMFLKIRVTYKNDIVVNLPNYESISQKEKYLHPVMEYWIASDNCECMNDALADDEIVYQCHGGGKYYSDGDFLDESEECSRGAKPFQFLLNNGPYFGIKIGIRSSDLPPWIK